jgi:hypothetical protein
MTLRIEQKSNALRNKCGRVVLKMALGCLLVSAVCASAAVTATRAPLSEHRVTREIVRNPHLRGVDHPAVIARHIDRTKTDLARRKAWLAVHHPWHRRWDYYWWIALHRGLGSIRGFVHGPGGEPMSSATVVLRWPGGRIIANASRKHLTYTDADGNFTMLGVRSGRYRVFAVRGKQKGHVITAVHPGFTASVSVKL